MEFLTPPPKTSRCEQSCEDMTEQGAVVVHLCSIWTKTCHRCFIQIPGNCCNKSQNGSNAVPLLKYISQYIFHFIHMFRFTRFKTDTYTVVCSLIPHLYVDSLLFLIQLFLFFFSQPRMIMLTCFIKRNPAGAAALREKIVDRPLQNSTQTTNQC